MANGRTTQLNVLCRSHRSNGFVQSLKTKQTMASEHHIETFGVRFPQIQRDPLLFNIQNDTRWRVHHTAPGLSHIRSREERTLSSRLAQIDLVLPIGKHGTPGTRNKKRQILGQESSFYARNCSSRFRQ